MKIDILSPILSFLSICEGGLGIKLAANRFQPIAVVMLTMAKISEIATIEPLSDCTRDCGLHGKCISVEEKESCHCFGSWSGEFCDLDQCSLYDKCDSCRSHFEDPGKDEADDKWGCTWTNSCAGVESPVAYNCPTISKEREMEEEAEPSYGSNMLVVAGVLSFATIAICIKRHRNRNSTTQEYELVPTEPPRSQSPSHASSKKSSMSLTPSKSHNSNDSLSSTSSSSKKNDDWSDWSEEAPPVHDVRAPSPNNNTSTSTSNKPLPDDLFEEFGMAPKPTNLSLLSLSSQLKFMKPAEGSNAKSSSAWGNVDDLA